MSGSGKPLTAKTGRELDASRSIVLFEVGNPAGWIADMLRAMGLDFKVANPNDPAWKWSNNPVKSDKKLKKYR